MTLGCPKECWVMLKRQEMYWMVGWKRKRVEVEMWGNLKKIKDEVIEKEIEAVAKAWHAGIVHLMGETEVVASEGASMGKRIMRNLRESKEVVDIPHERMLKVGMTYEL